jgi:DNA-binding IclR family transcriptional regulator
MPAQVKSAERVLDIIDLLVGEPEGLTFTALQQRLGLPKSSLYELLSVLADRRYIELAPGSQDEARPLRRAYLIGIRAWEAGQAYTQQHQLAAVARPVMEGVVRAINETVQLAVLDGLENVYLAKVDCSHPVRLQSEVGRRLHAHGTGLGKALLAFLPPDELRARLAGAALPAFTPGTITDAGQLLAELERVRARGYAVDDQEYTPGLQCVAVPIFDHLGRAAAALSVSIPTIRGGPRALAAGLQLIAAGSLEISRRLGRADADPLLERLALSPTPPAQLGLAEPTM